MQRVKSPRRLLALLASLAGAALAQAPPSAGDLLRDVTPQRRLPSGDAPPPQVQEGAVPGLPAGGERFTLRGVRLSGNQLFDGAQLQPLLQAAIGQPVDLAALDALAQRITRHYREHGYLVARAWLPPQQVQDGIVHIAVLEGRLGEVQLSNRAGLAGDAAAPLARLRAGDPVDRSALEGTLLRLADLPGVEVTSTLRPGQAVGTSDFLVDLAPGAPFAGSVDADSFGNRYTGANRLGASLNWNNPARLGDQLSLRAQTSDGDFAYGRIAYQLPVGPWATRVGVAWSHMRYGLGEELAGLRAKGNARVGSFYLQHPLLRSRPASWHATLQYDGKQLHDRLDSTRLVADKSLHNWTAGLTGELLDDLASGGASSVQVNYTHGRLDLDAAAAAADAASARSAGRFGKWALALQRQQRLAADWSLQGALSGQWAQDNLDASEKLSLGGASGVRAYPQGEASGDEGHLANLELRHAASPTWTLSAFYDWGRVRINHAPWGGAGASYRQLAGWGLGASWAAGPVQLRGFAAWRTGTGAARSAPQRSPRLGVQAVVRF